MDGMDGMDGMGRRGGGREDVRLVGRGASMEGRA